MLPASGRRGKNVPTSCAPAPLRQPIPQKVPAVSRPGCALAGILQHPSRFRRQTALPGAAGHNLPGRPGPAPGMPAHNTTRNGAAAAVQTALPSAGYPAHNTAADTSATPGQRHGRCSCRVRLDLHGILPGHPLTALSFSLPEFFRPPSHCFLMPQ